MRRPHTLTTVLCCIGLLAGCDGGGGVDEDAMRERAESLAQRLLILDTHVDLPYRLGEHPENVSQRTERGDFDYPRARAGGLDAPFMSIYVPASFQETGGAKEFAESLIGMVEGLVSDHPDKFALASSPADVRRNFEAGLVSLPMGMENGAPIEDDLANVAYFHGRGIRYITLTHSENNQICDSSYADDRTWNGLSAFGEKVVAEMNRQGIIIDVSHVSDEAFYRVMELTRAPAIASHSSCRHFTPGWERNMDDAMIRRLAEGGGVIQINFGSAFLAQAYLEGERERSETVRRWLEENGLERDHPEAQSYIERYIADNPLERVPIGVVVDHIDHVVELVGIDHVGLGSDFDGVGDSLPVGLEDASKLPNLIAELLRRGYSEEEIEKICSGNTLRVWSEVERVAVEYSAGR